MPTKVGMRAALIAAALLLPTALLAGCQADPVWDSQPQVDAADANEVETTVEEEEGGTEPAPEPQGEDVEVIEDNGMPFSLDDPRCNLGDFEDVAFDSIYDWTMPGDTPIDNLRCFFTQDRQVTEWARENGYLVETINEFTEPYRIAYLLSLKDTSTKIHPDGCKLFAVYIPELRKFTWTLDADERFLEDNAIDPLNYHMEKLVEWERCL